MYGDRAPFFPWERQFVTNWGCIHPEKQLTRGMRIKGFVYDKQLKEKSMVHGAVGTNDASSDTVTIVERGTFPTPPRIVLFSSLRPRCASSILVSSSTHSKTISM